MYSTGRPVADPTLARIAYSMSCSLPAVSVWFHNQSVIYVTLRTLHIVSAGVCRCEFRERALPHTVNVLQYDLWLVNIMSLHVVEAELE